MRRKNTRAERLPDRMSRAVRRRPRWKRACGEEGSALVEFALMLAVLMTFIFGLIEVSMALFMHQVIAEEAREGTRYAIVRGATCQTPAGASCTTTVAAVESYVASTGWPTIGGGHLAVNASFPGGLASNCAAGSQNQGCPVQVTVTYGFPLSIPMIPKSTLTMSSNSVMYIVQ